MDDWWWLTGIVNLLKDPLIWGGLNPKFKALTPIIKNLTILKLASAHWPHRAIVFIHRVNEVCRARCAWALWPEADPEGSWIWEPIGTTGRLPTGGRGPRGEDSRRQDAVYVI